MFLFVSPIVQDHCWSVEFPRVANPSCLAAGSQSHLADLSCKCSHSLKWVHGFIISFNLDVKLEMGFGSVCKERASTG